MCVYFAILDVPYVSRQAKLQKVIPKVKTKQKMSYELIVYLARISISMLFLQKA